MNKSPSKILMKNFDQRSLKAFEIFFLTKCSGLYTLTDTLAEASIIIIDYDANSDVSKLDNELLKIQSDYPTIIILALSFLEYETERENYFFFKKPINYLVLKQRLSTLIKLNQKYKKSILSDTHKVKHSIEIHQPKPIKLPQQVDKSLPIANKQKIEKYSPSTTAATTLGERDDTHYVGTNADVDFSDPESLLKAQYSPKRKLQGALLEAISIAKEHQCAVKIFCLQTLIIIDPMNDKVHTAVGDNVLRPMCLLDITDDELFEKLNNKELTNVLNSIGNKHKAWSLEAFVWKISLWSSRGFYPNTLDVEKTVYLSEWPNFTRLQLFPYAMQIAALLIQQPAKLNDIALQLNIPQRYVFSFVSSAESLGILSVSNRYLDQLNVEFPKQKDNSSRSILKKLLGRLVGLNASSQSTQKKRRFF